MQRRWATGRVTRRGPAGARPGLDERRLGPAARAFLARHRGGEDGAQAGEAAAPPRIRQRRAADVLYDGIGEPAWQADVIAWAKRAGWLVYHTHDSRRSPAGFPDLVLVREQVVYAELKTMRGELRTAQRVWIARLRAAGAEVHVWRPNQWAEVKARLSGRRAA